MRVRPSIAWLLTVLGAVAGWVLAWVLRSGRGLSETAGEPTQKVWRVPEKLSVAEVVFDSGFARGWEDWGWGPRLGTDGGPLKVGFAGYGGVIFRHAELPSRFGAVAFRYRAPRTTGEFLTVTLKNQRLDASMLPAVALEPRHLAVLDDGWMEALVPWSELNPKDNPFDRVVIQARELTSSDWVEIDKVVLLEPRPAGDAGGLARRIKLSVHCDRPATRINPMIYGISHGPRTAGETAHRIGGNTMSRHHWELGTWNVGSDWFFENVKGENGIYDWLKNAPRDELMHAVVVPMIGWVAKDGTSVGFPVSKFGAQRQHDPHRPEAGDGYRPDGRPIVPPPPSQTSVPAPPDTIRRWIERLRKQDAKAGGRSVDMYILDNEPDLWHVTHRDVHPEPLTYDELLDRTLRYGAAIREADPDAVIAGPASWGWPAYFGSAKDAAAGLGGLQPDRLRHGGVPLLAWYLRKLAEHEKRSGVRILDVLDVHFYPQAAGVYENGTERSERDTSARRLRSTRALWDPTYVDESWINEPIRLIPRLKEWIEKNYPGRGISLGEWSFGAAEHISGALAIVEALGRFGQQGLHAAFYWGQVKPNSPAFWAFRAYRNFDGRGGRFLEWSVPTSGVGATSIFASRDEAGTRLVTVLVNLDADYAAEADLELSSCGAIKSRRSFRSAPGAASLDELKEPPRRSDYELLAPASFSVLEFELEPQTQR